MMIFTVENPRVGNSILPLATKFREDAESRFAKFELGDFPNGHLICKRAKDGIAKSVRRLIYPAAPNL